jgi:hypothetical protein
MRTVQEALAHAQDLVSDYKAQKDLMKEMDKHYFMEWDDPNETEETKKLYKKTVSPSTHNALIGAIRLMTSTEPAFNVMYDVADENAKAVSEQIERLCKAIWYHSGRFKATPLEQPVVDALLRYGMAVISITDTSDLLKIMEDKKVSKSELQAVKRLVKTTPFLLEAWDPKGVYAEWGRFGLTAVYRQTLMRLAEVKQQFGENAIKNIVGTDKGDDNKAVIYADYWDLDKHIAWISSSEGSGEQVIAGEPIVDEEHGLPAIPIVIGVSEGSYMDVEREHQIMPLLYAAEKSGLWERENLELTFLYTNLFAIGTNPTFVYETLREEGDFRVDYSVPGGRLEIAPGEKYYPLNKDIITSDMLQGLSIASNGIEQSTMHKQALGGMGGIGANAAFSTVSLLNQAGRLPLTSPQKRGGWMIGTVMEIVFEMMKNSGGNRSVRLESGSVASIDTDLIPDDLIIEGKLEVDLPQDMLSQTNVAGMVIQSGLASRRWARQNLLNIGQSESMENEIWSENAGLALFRQYLQGEISKAQMMDQLKMQQSMEQMQGGMPLGAQQQQQGGMPQGVPAPQNKKPMGPRGAGSAINTQEGLLPAQRPGEQPAPPTMTPQPPQKGQV